MIWYSSSLLSWLIDLVLSWYSINTVNSNWDSETIEWDSNKYNWDESRQQSTERNWYHRV